MIVEWIIWVRRKSSLLPKWVHYEQALKFWTVETILSTVHLTRRSPHHENNILICCTKNSCGLARKNLHFLLLKVGGFPIGRVAKYPHFWNIESLQFHIRGNSEKFEGCKYFKEHIGEPKCEGKDTACLGELCNYLSRATV